MTCDHMWSHKMTSLKSCGIFVKNILCDIIIRSVIGIKVRRQGMARKNQHKDHRIDQKLQFRQFNSRNKKALSLKKFEISRTEI